MIEAGFTIITENELDNITGMARSLAAHPLVKAGILDGEVERSMFWQDPETGLWLKSRPDNIPNDSGDYADLKTTVSVKTDALMKALADYEYPMQAALTGEASRMVLGREMETFTFVFVETKRPWCVRVVALRPSDLDRATMQNHHAIRMFANGMRTGFWPGPGGVQEDAEYLSPAPWAIKRNEDRLELLAQSDDDGDLGDRVAAMAEEAQQTDEDDQ